MLNEVDKQMQMLLNSEDKLFALDVGMRVGLFLLVSVVVHLAAGHWLDWRTPPSASSPAAVAQAQAVALPRLVTVAPPAPIEPEVASVGAAEAPPAPVAPAVVPRPDPTPVPEPRKQPQAKALQLSRTPPVEPAPPAEPVAVPQQQQQQQEQQEQQASAATAPQLSAPSPELPVAEPVEVVSQAPRFREPPAAPVYPTQARRRNQQGQVLVEVRLDAQGEQREVRLVQSSGFTSLDRAALEAVADWKFQPELLAGRPTPSRVRIPIDFALSARR